MPHTPSQSAHEAKPLLHSSYAPALQFRTRTLYGPNASMQAQHLSSVCYRAGMTCLWLPVVGEMPGIHSQCITVLLVLITETLWLCCLEIANYHFAYTPIWVVPLQLVYRKCAATRNQHLG